jgi:hypothetical protein
MIVGTKQYSAFCRIRESLKFINADGNWLALCLANAEVLDQNGTEMEG